MKIIGRLVGGKTHEKPQEKLGTLNDLMHALSDVRVYLSFPF